MMIAAPTTTATRTTPSVAADPRWARIVARDKTADGHLWYSVLTTGVYCRSSCPSRLAHPKNVQLHDTLESAKATGLRPCKRCQPNRSSIDAAGLIEEIGFAVGQTSLGVLLVASSTKGIAAILLGDDADALVRNLQDRFADARLIAHDRDDEKLVARVVGFVETPGRGLDLPLDVRGTAFQQRVWTAIRDIPAGSTASYREIAARIGAPKAVRAVAQACASNDIAVAIPCHRVVRTDGSTSGYRWGVARKRALLAREKAA